MDIRYHYLPDDEADRLYRLYPKLGSDPRKFCPTCDKKGTYTWKGVEHKCDCVLQLQLHKHYLAAGIGVTYQRIGWDDLINEDAREVAELYLKSNLVDRGIGMILTGLFGTGKTLACNLVLKDLVKRGYVCYATTFASMIQFYTSGWKDDEEKEYFNRRVVRSDVLLLDDLGKEFSNRLSESTFDDVLRTRVQSGRATLITTNMTEEEIGSGYGPAILSMLDEVSLVKELEGKDFRRQAKKIRQDEMLRGEVRPIE